MKKSILTGILKGTTLVLLLVTSACSGSPDLDGDLGSDDTQAAFADTQGSNTGSEDNFWSTNYAAGNEDSNGNGYVNVGGEIVGYGPDM